MYVEGVCPKCGVNKRLSRHHIIPRRFDKTSNRLFYLCRECHSRLEKDIAPTKQLTELEYYQIIIRFLNRGKKYSKRGKPI